MKHPLPKPLFLAILLIVVSIVSVSVVMAINTEPKTTQKPTVERKQTTASSIPLVRSNTQEQAPADQSSQPLTITPEPTPEPESVTKKVASPQPKAQPQPQPTVKAATNSTTKLCTGGLTTKFLCLLNEYRASKNLGALTYSNSLAGVALTHSTWMSTTDTLAHINSDGVRHNVRCEIAGITCRAENLAQGIMDAEQLLSEWKKSGSHNINLLGPYTSIGLGISSDYITLLFN